MEKILFIVGVGRSGTTLLQNMLNSHPQICFIREINYTRRFLLNNGLNKVYKQDQLEFVKYFKNDKWLKRLDDSIINKIDLNKLSKSNFSVELYKQILEINCSIKNKSIAGDKDPKSIEIVDKISNKIPNIQWIHIIRDPRDVILSKMNADWSKNRSKLYNIFASRVHLEFAKKWEKLFQKSFIEIHYEDLVTNPEDSLKKLCHRLDIEYNPSMIEFQNSAKEIIAKDELAWKREVLSPILNNNISKWKKSLSSEIIGIIESLVSPAFSCYCYEKSNPKISLITKIKIQMFKPIFYILSKFYILLK